MSTKLTLFQMETDYLFNNIFKSKLEYYKCIYLENVPVLLRFANKFVSTSVSEDLVHDVFIRLWYKYAFDNLSCNAVKRLLYVSVRNACIDYLRHLKFEQQFLDTRAIQLKLDELEYSSSKDDWFVRNDLIEALMKEINKLPERSQKVFYLTYIDGLRAKEIAELLQVSVRTVENLLYRSVLYLKQQCSHLF